MKQIKFLLIIRLLLLCFIGQAQVTTNFNNENIISKNGYFTKGYQEKIDFDIPE